MLPRKIDVPPPGSPDALCCVQQLGCNRVLSRHRRARFQQHARLLSSTCYPLPFRTPRAFNVRGTRRGFEVTLNRTTHGEYVRRSTSNIIYFKKFIESRQKCSDSTRHSSPKVREYSSWPVSTCLLRNILLE